MQASNNPPLYHVVLSQTTLSKLRSHQRSLSVGIGELGDSFRRILIKQYAEENSDINNNTTIGSLCDSVRAISLAKFLEHLINAKTPYISNDNLKFGRYSINLWKDESGAYTSITPQPGWSKADFNILKGLVIIFDKLKVHDGCVPFTCKYNDDMEDKEDPNRTLFQPYEASVAFMPGACLEDRESPDYQALIQEEVDEKEELITGWTIDQNAYHQFHSEKLWMALKYANDRGRVANKKVFVTIPNIDDRSQRLSKPLSKAVAKAFDKTLKKVLTDHSKDLNYIQAVYYDPMREPERLLDLPDSYDQEREETINGIELTVKSLASYNQHYRLRRGLLSPPGFFARRYQNCMLFSIAGCKPLSYPGNRLWKRIPWQLNSEDYGKNDDEYKAGSTNLRKTILRDSGLDSQLRQSNLSSIDVDDLDTDNMFKAQGRTLVLNPQGNFYSLQESPNPIESNIVNDTNSVRDANALNAEFKIENNIVNDTNSVRDANALNAEFKIENNIVNDTNSVRDANALNAEFKIENNIVNDTNSVRDANALNAESKLEHVQGFSDPTGNNADSNLDVENTQLSKSTITWQLLIGLLLVVCAGAAAFTFAFSSKCQAKIQMFTHPGLVLWLVGTVAGLTGFIGLCLLLVSWKRYCKNQMKSLSIEQANGFQSSVFQPINESAFFGPSSLHPDHPDNINLHDTQQTFTVS